MVIASILLSKSHGSATPGRTVHQVLEVEVSAPLCFCLEKLCLKKQKWKFSHEQMITITSFELGELLLSSCCKGFISE